MYHPGSSGCRGLYSIGSTGVVPIVYIVEICRLKYTKQLWHGLRLQTDLQPYNVGHETHSGTLHDQHFLRSTLQSLTAGKSCTISGVLVQRG